MRVLSLLSLLCLCVLGVSGQYIVDGTSSFSNGWVLTGLGNNPVLNFTAGNTYNFTITAVGTSHPFAFSSAENAGSATITAVNTTFYNVSATGADCGGTATGGFTTPTNTGAGCVVNIAIATNAPNATLFYKCTVHSFMTGKINIWAAPAAGNTTNTTTVAPTTAAPTTVAPTTLAPTTVAPGGNTTGNATTVAPTTLAPTTNAPTTGAPTTPAPTTGTIASNTFRITGNAATNAWIFTANNQQYANPTLTVTAGSAVTFSFELPNSRFHPFGFSSNSSPTLLPTQLNDTTVFPNELQTYTTTTCVTNYFTNIKTVYANANTTCTITVPAAQVQQGTLYYRCARHPAMVGTINVVAAPNSASTITLSGLTIVVAFIAALMA